MNYKLSISKSKNARIFYIQTSYRKGAKVCTKTVKKLGNETFIKETYGVEDAEAWARAELERMRQAAREDKQGLMMELHPDKLTDNVERIFNGGDVFIERAATLLGLRALCDKVSEDYKFKFKLSDYLLRMVCSRILHPGSKLSDFINGRRFIENKDLRLENFYRSLDVLTREMGSLQGGVYRHTLGTMGRNTGVIYYDCTNVFLK